MNLVELQLIELPLFHHCSRCCQIPDRGSIFSVRLQEWGRFVISPSSSWNISFGSRTFNYRVFTLLAALWPLYPSICGARIRSLRLYEGLNSIQPSSFINSKATEECKMTNTAQIFSFIPILYHFKTYFFAVTATRNLSQLYKNQIPNNKLSKIAFCYHPRLSHNANCPTKIPPAFAHTLPDGPSKTPQNYHKSKIHFLIFPSKN